MSRNFIAVGIFVLVCSLQQFAMLRNVATALQRRNFVEINSYFIQEFLRLVPHFKDPANVQLFSQLPLHQKLEYKLFKLAAEQDVDIQVLLSKMAAEEQSNMLKDMNENRISVGVLPDDYRFINWQEYYDTNEECPSFKITNNKGVPSTMIATLIAYHSQETVVLLGKEKGTFCMHNSENFAMWQKKFDRLLQKNNPF